MNGTPRLRPFLLVALALVILAAPAWGQTLYSVAQGDAQLRTIDPATAQTTSSVAMTLAGQTINGATGLATHPTSGQLFVVLNVQGVAGRVLGTVNPATGVVTQIGNTGDAIAGIAFDGLGNLYGVTGENGSSPESLFSINQTTAAIALIGALGRGDDGEAIGFNPLNNLMYHASGHIGVYNSMTNNGVIFERFNPAVAPLAPTDIPISGPPLTNEEAQALTFEPSTGMFLWKQNHGTGPLFRVNPVNAAAIQVGTMDMDHQAKGLAFAGGFSIAVVTPSTGVLTVPPRQPATFVVVVTPLGGVFGAQVDLSCTVSPFVGTCAVNPMTIPAGSGTTNVDVTVTPTIFGSVPPGTSPIPWIWLAAFALTLIAAGVIGRRRVARLGYAVSFGLVLLVASLAMLQASCAGSTGQKLQGPYQVTITATSGGVTHSTSATYNVSH